MYSKEITRIVPLLLIVLSLSAYFIYKQHEITKYNYSYTDFNAKKKIISKLSKKIKKCSLNICAQNKNYSNLNSAIIKIAKACNLSQVKFKDLSNQLPKDASNNPQAKIELSITCSDETSIYNFIIQLYQIPKIINFNKIDIIKNNKNIIEASLLFTIYPIENNNCIFFKPRKASNTPVKIELIKLQAPNLTHFLLCTIDQSLAFIDKKWMKIGDKVDGYAITKINQSSIKIQNDNISKTIEVGKTW